MFAREDGAAAACLFAIHSPKTYDREEASPFEVLRRVGRGSTSTLRGNGRRMMCRQGRSRGEQAGEAPLRRAPLSRPARRLLSVALIALSTAMTGCAASQEQRQSDRAVADYFMGDFRGAERRLQTVAQQKDENFVLNNVRLGSAALANYDLDEAEAAFLRAYEVINSVGVNNGGRTLGAVLVSREHQASGRASRTSGRWPTSTSASSTTCGTTTTTPGPRSRTRCSSSATTARAATRPTSTAAAESNFALGYLMLAKCWQRLGDEDKARQNFDRVVELRSLPRPRGRPGSSTAGRTCCWWSTSATARGR